MSNPMDEDFVPASSQFFGVTEPQDQKNDREAEEAKVYQALPILREIIARFSERIAFYSSVESIDKELMTKPAEFMHAVAANKAMTELLEAEKDYLESLLDDIK